MIIEMLILPFAEYKPGDIPVSADYSLTGMDHDPRYESC